MDTGRLIHDRYRLLRPVKQGQVCTLYQGNDERLQRMVAIKIVPGPLISAYHAAIKLTASFSHPNIIGLYDLVIAPDLFYVVQEYVEGDDFAALLQRQLSPYEVADIGSQICLALIYAAAPERHVTHGDLTPAAIIRERTGLVRVNNFALPPDTAYFQSWSVMGGDGVVISDGESPYGMFSEGRRADDTRAVGLLLYQLLAGRTPGSVVVEPRPDGVLNFQRTVPRELCDVVARSVVRQHPNPIATPESLYIELKTLADMWEPPLTPPLQTTGYPSAEPMIIRQHSPAPGKLATALPARDAGNQGTGLGAYRAGQSSKLPVADVSPASPTVADVPLKLITARQAAYPQRREPTRKNSPSIALILLLGLLAFVILFLVGYFVGQYLIR